MIKFPGKRFIKSLILDSSRRNLRCLFVLSTGRTGTDTITRLLDMSPEICAEHEPFPEMLAETKKAYQDPTSVPDVAAYYHDLRYFRLPGTNSLRRCSNRRLIYAETSNRLTYIAPALADYFPQSRFIFLHRNPPDVIRSAMRRRYYDGHPWDAHRIEPRADDPFRAHWEGWSPFERCCWYWRAVNDFSQKFVTQLPKERTFTLSSTALFAADPSVMLPIFDWLKTPAPSLSEMQQVLQVRHNSQEQGDFPTWMEWTEDLRSRMVNVVRGVDERIGYEYSASFHSTVSGSSGIS